MKVEPEAKLINYSSEPEKNVAVAARLCYSKKEAEDIVEDMNKNEIEKLVRKVINMGHTSTLEHTFFYFHIRCSRVTSHQLVRQRIGTSYSQRSQRYVKEDEFAYIIPPSIEENNEAKKLYIEKMKELQEVYNKLLSLEIPEEDARFILPTIKTNLMVSYNARSLMHFFSLRCCQRAQWEIRTLAEQMLEQVRDVAPVIFDNAGPPCVIDQSCPEGELSCGRINNSEGAYKSEKNAD